MSKRLVQVLMAVTIVIPVLIAGAGIVLAQAPSVDSIILVLNGTCGRDVIFYIRDFVPNSSISTSMTGVEWDCNGRQKPQVGWSNYIVKNTDDFGRANFGFTQGGYGRYDYTFTDAQGNKATAHVEYGPTGSNSAATQAAQSSPPPATAVPTVQASGNICAVTHHARYDASGKLTRQNWFGLRNTHYLRVGLPQVDKMPGFVIKFAGQVMTNLQVAEYSSEWTDFLMDDNWVLRNSINLTDHPQWNDDKQWEILVNC
jgi:hypothetical protein